MNNPYDILPSYIKESPKFSKFLSLVNAYLLSGALQIGLYENGFTEASPSRYVIQTLAAQLNVTVEVTFKEVNGTMVPDWNKYFNELYYAYLSKSFRTSFDGTNNDFITNYPLSDVSSAIVIDFSVAKNLPESETKIAQRSPMSVLYSVLSTNEYLTLNVVRDNLIPAVTGVGATLYYLQFGELLFGYDIDVCKEFTTKDGRSVAVVDREGSGRTPEEKEDYTNEDNNRTTSENDVLYHTVYKYDKATNKYTVNDVVYDVSYVVDEIRVASSGTGYNIGDIVVANVGTEESPVNISMEITSTAIGSLCKLSDPGARYSVNPSRTSIEVSGSEGVTGTGMRVSIVSQGTQSYQVRGFDNGRFLSITRRGEN